MSDTNTFVRYGANLNEKFGIRLPTPFIDKITIEEELIKVTVSLYFNLNQMPFDNFEDYIASFGGHLSVRGHLLMDQLLFRADAPDYYYYVTQESEEPSGPFDALRDGDGEGSNYNFASIEVSPIVTGDAYSEVIGGRRNILSTYQLSWTPYYEIDPGVFETENFIEPEIASEFVTSIQYPEGSVAYDFGTVAIDNTEDGWQESDLVNEDNVPIKRLTKTLPIDSRITAYYYDLSNHEEYTLSISDSIMTLVDYLEQIAPLSDALSKVGFAAFSTSMDTAALAAVRQWDLLNASDQQLYSSQISDVAYCTIYQDGSLRTPLENIFVDPANNVVYDPIQSVNSIYYKQDNITLADINEALLQMVGGLSNSDAELQAAQNNILYILSVYGDKPELLVRLNALRQTFLDTSNVTPVGRLYNALKGAIYNANIAVQRGTRVRKELIANPRVRDLRDKGLGMAYPDISANIAARNGLNYATGTDATVEPNEYSYSNSYIYPGEFKISRYVVS